jgi:2-iminobutanoate/2-iminopropanoate deaminase
VAEHTSISIVETTAAPAAIGPYAQGVCWGRLVFTSGQIGIDPSRGTLVGPDPKAQAKQALANLAGILKAAGSSPEAVLKTTVYLTDLTSFQDVNEVYAEFFQDHRPARATAEAAALPLGALVEIEAIAISDKEFRP